MFLHIGGEYDIPIKDIVFIMDVQSSFKSKYSRYCLTMAENEGRTIKITEKEAKSIVFTQKRKRGSMKDQIFVYYSPISSITLLKRAGFIYSDSLETEVIE